MDIKKIVDLVGLLKVLWELAVKAREWLRKRQNKVIKRGILWVTPPEEDWD